MTILKKAAAFLAWYKQVAIIYRLMVASIVFALWYVMSGENLDIAIRMPGSSFVGTVPDLTSEEQEIKTHLHTHLDILARQIGERNMQNSAKLNAARDYITHALRKGGYVVSLQTYTVNGVEVSNIEAERKGSKNPEEILVIGAHYDAAAGSPAANDNGSGTVALLELARLLAEKNFAHTVRFVAFVNEEPPYFQTSDMGSLVYAKRCKERNEHITGMISLETIGYFSNRKSSQHYPFPLNYFYPDTANFIGFIGNSFSSPLVRKTIASFRHHTAFPSEGAGVPAFFIGVGASDHWSFWKQGYPAIMITDTAFYRYPYYHTRHDTVDKINETSLARIVKGMSQVIEDLAKE